jgi:peroxiredoxin
MAEPLAVGSPAPDFSLPATGGRTVSRRDYQDKHNLIVVFYVGDNTPDCNRQLRSLQDELDELEAAATTVLAINTGALDDHERYAEQMGFAFPLLHDPGARVADLYGARQDDGTVRRMVYLIDKQGIVRYGKPGMHWHEEFFTALSELM